MYPFDILVCTLYTATTYKYPYMYEHLEIITKLSTVIKIYVFERCVMLK